MKPSFLYLLMAVLLTSCIASDDDNQQQYPVDVTIHGRMLDAATLDPIPGGKIYYHRNGGAYPDESTTSGPDGSYSFTFEYHPDYFYHMHAVADRYLGNRNIGIWGAEYPHGGATPQLPLNPWDSPKIDIRLPPEGFLSYHLKQTKAYPGPIQVRITPYNYGGVVTFNGQGLNAKYFDRLPGGG